MPQSQCASLGIDFDFKASGLQGAPGSAVIEVFRPADLLRHSPSLARNVATGPHVLKDCIIRQAKSGGAVRPCPSFSPDGKGNAIVVDCDLRILAWLDTSVSRRRPDWLRCAPARSRIVAVRLNGNGLTCDVRFRVLAKAIATTTIAITHMTTRRMKMS
jgi:hypothetical protein